MSYYFSTTLKVPFEQAVADVGAALARRGFGILCDIDVQATLKKKLGVEMHPYRILGACNPPMAHKALRAEDKIGTMLPCNVVVQDHGAAGVEVAAIDPVASMQAINNPELASVATEVRGLLQQVIDDLSHPPSV